MTLSLTILCHYDERRYADHCVLFIATLNAIMQSVIMLNVMMLSVIILIVIILNVIILNVIILNVIILNVIILNVIFVGVIMLNAIMTSVAALTIFKNVASLRKVFCLSILLKVSHSSTL
jgi:hypothetical protein